jgi:hypothetical protein
MAEPEVVTIKRKRGRRSVVIGIIVVVVLAGAGIGYAMTSGGKKSTAAATVSTATNRPAAGQRRNGVSGTLASVSGDTLLVTDQNGVKTTVHTNSSTVYLTTATGALSDVKVGDRLVAMGTNAGTNQISATRVNDTSGMDAINGPGNGQGGPPGGRRFGNGTGGNRNGANANNPNAPAPGTFAFGTVSSINGNIILVKDTNGTVTTVDTTAATTFSVVKRIALTDLQTGQQVRVNGPKAADGSITATAVQEGTGGFGGFGRRGGGNGTGNGGTDGSTTGIGG